MGEAEGYLDNDPSGSSHNVSGGMRLPIGFLHILLQIMREVGKGHTVRNCTARFCSSASWPPSPTSARLPLSQDFRAVGAQK